MAALRHCTACGCVKIFWVNKVAADFASIFLKGYNGIFFRMRVSFGSAANHLCALSSGPQSKVVIQWSKWENRCTPRPDSQIVWERANVSSKYAQSKVNTWLSEKGSKATSLWHLYANIDGNYVRLLWCADWRGTNAVITFKSSASGSRVVQTSHTSLGRTS